MGKRCGQPNREFRLLGAIVGSTLVVAACGGGPVEIAFDDVTNAGVSTAVSVAPTEPSVPSPQTAPELTDNPTQISDVRTTDEPTTLASTEEAWRNVTYNLAGMESACGNLSIVTATPESGDVIVAVVRRGLWKLDRASETWNPLGTGPGSDEVANGPSSILFDPDDPAVFWEAGSYYANGIYRTEDGGETFRAMGDVVHADAVSVDMTDPERQTVVASLHEQPDIVLSTDGGESWRSLASNLPSDVGSSNMPHVVDSTTILIGSWLTERPGILRSTDQGESWERVFDGYVLELGAPTVLGDGSILWVLHNGLGVIQSVDGGATWKPLSYPPLVVPIVDMGDGRLAAATSDQVVVSEDNGVSWSWVGPLTPFPPASFAYSTGDKSFYVTHSDCEDAVLQDGIAALGTLEE